MISEVLTDENFVIYAAQHYDNPGCSDTQEFYEDIKRFKYVKKLFKRYVDTGDLKERLILNHIIILYNVFGIPATTRLLFQKLDGYHKYLKPFLVLLNYMPETIRNVGKPGNTIISSDIVMDQLIIDRLRGIRDAEV